MNEKQIILSVGEGYEGRVSATFAGPERLRILDLFGSDTIPTPFCIAVNAPDTWRDSIAARIAEKNPGYRVIWA